ncbi:MAG: hypothetical protein H7288_02370 [Kineosporiaceae bacterium]|nr:hypothetical protein [Aeromicrobium sp.]
MTAADEQSETTSRRNPRDPKPVPPGSAAAEHAELVDVRLKLDTLRTQHLEVGGIVISAGGGNLYQDDMLVMTMLQRSYGLVDAVIDLVDSRIVPPSTTRGPFLFTTPRRAGFTCQRGT